MQKFLNINPEKTSQKIINFLKKEFSERQKRTAILAISGGIDSAVCAFLCAKAKLNLYLVNLPYGGQSVKDGMSVAKELKLSEKQTLTINIGRVVDEQIKEIEKSVKLDQVDKGNIMARQRMIVQYALAKKLNGLVVGTENLSEYYLAYFTLYGDQACDIRPIASLLKTQVYQLGKYLGVPEKITKKAPSAELWKEQTDEKELGFSYEEADPIIYLYKVKNLNKEKILKKYPFNNSLINKVIERIDSTEYKRENPPKCIFC
ncbi:NAD+ synthase [bacterium]|nr:MAG: NAD+ synthase [bacterium]